MSAITAERAASLRRRAPRLALRALTALALPVLAAAYMEAMGFYRDVADLGLPLGFLDRGPFAYEGKVVAFVTLVLVLGAYAAGARAPRLVLALCVFAVLCASFVHSRIQWARLVWPEWRPRDTPPPGEAGWVLAFLLLALGVAFVLAEWLLDLHESQAARGVRSRGAHARVAAQATTLALAGGLAFAALGATLFWALRPGLARLRVEANPAVALFALGVLLAAAVAFAVRPAKEPDAPR